LVVHNIPSIRKTKNKVQWNALLGSLNKSICWRDEKKRYIRKGRDGERGERREKMI
jgi:hypothetical protein